MPDITQIRKLSVWIFCIPLLAINLCLLISQNPSFLENTIDNKSLSSGQMQKIAFIRAFLNNPDILLLDESTANLDIDSKELIYSKIKDLKITVINSSHEYSFEEIFDQTLTIEIKDNKRIIVER